MKGGGVKSAARKPLNDLSNKNGSSSSFTKSHSTLNNKKNTKNMNMNMESENNVKDDDNETLKAEQDNALDNLLLVQSNLSSLLHQVDELVVQAFKLNGVSKEGRKEIESFSHVLSDMLSSLKPWVPRFQNALSSTSAESESQPQECMKGKTVSSEDSDVCDELEEATKDSLVSPSPLVSWRANCTIQRGRQMFMLTPLPISKTLSSKFQKPSKSEFNKLASSTNDVGKSTILAFSGDMNDFLDSVVVKPTPAKPAPSAGIKNVDNQEHGLVSSPLFPKRENSIVVMMTPSFKMSPPKSCVLLEPISETYHRLGDLKSRKSTPFPIGIHYSDSEDSESPSSDASQGLASKKFIGTHQVSKPRIQNKTVEASPYWLTSPPKTCVLLEPSDDNSVELDKADNSESCIQIPETVLNHQINKLQDEVPKDHNEAKNTCNQDNAGGKMSHLENTPMWQEPGSSFQTGKRAGENTLKKELWSKFEAASTFGFLPKLPTGKKDTHKGFLDLLEEACDDE